MRQYAFLSSPNPLHCLVTTSKLAAARPLREASGMLLACCKRLMAIDSEGESKKLF